MSAGLVVTLAQESGRLQNMRSGASKRPFCSLHAERVGSVSGWRRSDAVPSLLEDVPSLLGDETQAAGSRLRASAHQEACARTCGKELTLTAPEQHLRRWAGAARTSQYMT